MSVLRTVMTDLCLKEITMWSSLRILWKSGREKYEAAADIVVQTDNKTILQICEELISKLMELDTK